MNIQKADQKFFIGDDEQYPKAVITYGFSDDGDVVINHPEVSDDLRGQGVAGKLVEEVVNYAREEAKKVNPVCPYAKN
uniref:GNAT family N-acetyltransferase n=1 Tax=Virgibacillus massiliensis TaxID=1462526 RepID=UPI0018E0CA25